MEWLADVSATHWLVLGLGLLALEAAIGIGYLFGPGLAALLIALLSVILPIGANAQLLLFAVSSIAATYAYVRYFKRAPGEEDSATGLHNRTQAMIGRETTLQDDIAGNARIPFGDTLWRVKSAVLLAKGTKVVVTNVEDDRLIVEEQIPSGTN